MSIEETRSTNAVWTAVIMLVTILCITAIIFGFRYCSEEDARIQDCLSNGHHTACECRLAYGHRESCDAK